MGGRTTVRTWSRGLLVLAAAALLAAGVWSYRAQERAFRQRVGAELTSIGQLEADRIAAWRDDQLADAALLAENPFVVRGLTALWARPDEAGARQLRRFLRHVQEEHDYSDILIVDAAGRVRLSLSGAAELPSSHGSALATASRERRRVFVDLYPGEDGSGARTAVVAPLLADGADAGRSIGAIAFVSDAADLLYPLLRTWPTSRETAETYLVRRENGHALVLNDLRHRSGTALRLRIPLDRVEVPAVQAVRGGEGVVHGIDYRGEKVVSAILPVPGSPWFMVVEMARSEAFAGWHRRSLLLAGLVLGWLGTLGGAALVARQRRDRRHRRRLAESERRYRTLLEKAPDAIFVQTGGRFALVNEACARLLGAGEASELVGRPVLERVHPDSAERGRAHIVGLEEERRPVASAEEAVVTLAGETIPVEVEAVPLEYDGQDGALVFMRDLRARRAEERELRRQRQMLERTERVAHVGSWEWNLETDEVAWSEELYRIFGRDPSRAPPPFAGHHVLYPPDDMERLREAMERTVAEGEPFELELRAVRTDGEIRDCVGRGFPERDPESGRVVRLYGSFQDVTERKREEVTRERLMTAIEQSAESVMITDAEGAIQYANPSFERITGYRLDEVVGRNPRILKSGEHDEELYRELWTTISSGRVWQGRMVNRRKDGSPFTEEQTISPVRDASGRIVNYVAVKRDITEELRLESRMFQMEKLESVGRLAGGVAHDFNNMLNVIGGYAELLLDKLAPENLLRADVQEILSAAERAGGVTRQLLGFARRQTIAPEAIDFDEAVEEIFAMLRPLIGEEIEIAWHPAPEVWPVRLDRVQVSQILANLCVNARDAIAGVGTITIETANVTFDEAYSAEHPGSAAGEFAMLAVSDDGRGMDRETMASVFEPFFTTKRKAGTGLGLASVYGIVRQNGGFINVYSEPGEGSTFRLYFPRHVPRHASRHRGEPAGSEPARGDVVPRGSGETVLLVEDDEQVRRLARRFLESLGYTVLEAATPSEAVRVGESREAGIDLLLTDVVMPEMNGRELAEHLGSVDPGLRVLFMSGYTASAISHRDVLEEGVHFVQKPFSMEDLAAAVRKALGDGG